MPLCSGQQNSAEIFQRGPGTGHLDALGQTDRQMDSGPEGLRSAHTSAALLGGEGGVSSC